MRFRLTFYKTLSDNKFDSDNRFEYLGDAESIWNLWFLLTKTLNYKHVEVFSLDGVKQKPENGGPGLGLQDYNL
jgi:hypothetical protein